MISSLTVIFENALCFIISFNEVQSIIFVSKEDPSCVISVTPIVSYTVLPGKGLDAQISADVTDFEMDAVSINGVKLNLNVDIDDEELMDKVREITDAEINEYTQGVAAMGAASSQIADGTGVLVSGSKALAAGSDTLKQETIDMYSGMTSLDDGAKQLNDGTKEFYEQTDGMAIKIEDTVNEMLDSISGGDSEIVSFVSDKNTDVNAVQFVIKIATI